MLRRWNKKWTVLGAFVFLALIVAAVLLLMLKPVHAFPSNNTVLDNFNRTNADPLSNPMSGGDSWHQTTLSGGSGGGARLRIVGNTAQSESTSGQFSSDYDNTTTYGPDTELYATVVATGNASSGNEILALYVRLDSNVGFPTFKGYELEVDTGSSSNWIVWRADSSSTFQEMGVLANTTGSRQSQAISAGDAVGIKITGTGATVSIEGWYKASGGSWTSKGTWTDSSTGKLTAAGKLGLEIRGSTTEPQIDDLSGGTVVSNVAPAAPTLSSPSDVATGVSTTPQFQLRTTDADNDYLRYEIQVCSTSNCSSVVRTICQDNGLPNGCSASQTGWTGQDQQGSTAYTGNSVITSSTMATHNYQAPALSAGTQYWWRGYAIDPGGTNTSSSASSIFSFTTSNVPAAPTLSTPSSSATGVSMFPQFRLRTTDADNDYLRYEIVVYQSDCSTLVRDIDQTSSQDGWIGQDQQTNTAYTGNASIGSSTMAVHNYQSSALSSGTTYCWKARAIDPGGSNSWSSYSATQTFTTRENFPYTGILDDFNRANQNPLSSPNWTNISNVQIAGNQIAPINTSGTSLQWATSFSGDVEAYISFPIFVNGLDIAIINGSGHGYYVEYNSSNGSLYTSDNVRLDGPVGAAPQDGDKYGLRVRQNGDIEVWRYRSGLWSMVMSANDTTYSGPWYLSFGTWSGSTLDRMDDAGGGTIRSITIQGGTEIRGGTTIGN